FQAEDGIRDLIVTGVQTCALPISKFRKVAANMEADEGIHNTTADGLAKLKPVLDGGTVTFGGQTHPADGNTAVVVASRDKAREQIGRASCRERGESEGGAGAREKE